MEEEKEGEKIFNDEAVAKSDDKNVAKSTETKSKSENKMSPGIQTVIVLIIGLLAIIVLVLLGYIMYQTGKNSTNNEHNEPVTMDKVIDNKKDEIVPEEQDNQSDVVLEHDDDTKVQDVISKNSISVEDLDKLDGELDEVSTNYDDLESVSTDLQKWSN